MMIDRLIKMHHYVSCIVEEDETSTKETIKLLINHVWKLHELSNTIVSNQQKIILVLQQNNHTLDALKTLV
jgi:hypothetical protein